MLRVLFIIAACVSCSRRPPTRARTGTPARVLAPTVGAATAVGAAPTAYVVVGLGRTLRLPPPFHTPSVSNPVLASAAPAGFMPTVAEGLRIAAWASAPHGGRWIAVAPDGAVFLASHEVGTVETLRDTDGDGRAETRTVFARGLTLPLGMAFHPDGWLYVACTNALVRFRYAVGQTVAASAPERVLDLPGLGYNQHWTRNVIVSPDARKLYVTVGSETNVEVETDPRRGAITACDPDGRNARVYASGLRNPLGMAFHPDTRGLFVVVNERDMLGDDLVPDYLTEVREGAFYGWPFAYFGAHEDPRRAGERPDLVRAAVVPDLSLGAHVAPLSVIFPLRDGVAAMRGDALISLHGSWNRSRPVGYKVVRVRFANGHPTGVVEDFITGWLAPNDKAWGRPSGLAELPDGSLLVVDDANEVIWRVARATP